MLLCPFDISGRDSLQWARSLVELALQCKYCDGSTCRKNGYSGGLQRYNCKDCNRNWTLGQCRAYGAAIRFQALKLYLEGLGFRSIGRILGVSNVTVLKWIRSMGEKLFQEGALWKNSDLKSVAQIQIDEFWHYVKKNEISYGFGVAICGKTKQILAIFCSKRTKRSVRHIWSLIKNLHPKFVFTDKWRSYRGIVPKRNHVIGKKYTQAIESINATFRHYLCRFRRKTKGYSKSKHMVEVTLAVFAFKFSIIS